MRQEQIIFPMAYGKPLHLKSQTAAWILTKFQTNDNVGEMKRTAKFGQNRSDGERYSG